MEGNETDQQHIIQLHYDHFADTYSEVKPSIQRIVSRLKGSVEGKVLDIGCANGYLLFHLSNQHVFQDYIGADLSQNALKLAQTHVQRSGSGCVSFTCANAMDLPFSSQYFDAVVSNAVFHLIPNQHQALQEVMRVLKPAGVAVLQFPGGGDIEPELFDLLHQAWDEVVPGLDLPIFYHTLTLNRVRELMDDLGIWCFEINCRQNRMMIQDANIQPLLDRFQLVSSFWRWGLDPHTADRIEQLVALKATQQLSSRGYFYSTRNQLLIEITKPS
jgi:ubiquinone/menaquinone biosynthesis C-methylase UbiE